MKLDDTVQQCTSYRPHYHEFAVHFPSRFLKQHQVKRVLFVGGGDSMVLHDVLKYPSLELVVGLELDQFVVRNSFRYFNTQPHFDDNRVEWWFGDGAKSLLMLPKSYFGSFDLVVVDLSETVMSFQVTDKLSIFQTLSLLLQPEGIMLKNGEYYMETMSQHFDYTLQYFEYDDDSDTDVVGKQAGILMIVEAENLTKTTTTSDEESLISTLKKVGLTPISTVSSASAASSSSTTTFSTIVIIMEEGYIIARSWPGKSYCALDIQLWGSFQ
ncbi:S-adenosyl-L-methionine-dependent methyltransferase, partial [Fragilariopsis cylindrus CCMP1102]